MRIPPVLKKIVGYYVAWTFIHVVFLSLGWSGVGHDDFWPFTENSTILKSYDISEFLVYVLGPLVTFYVLFQLFATDLDETIEKKQFDQNEDKLVAQQNKAQSKKLTLFSENELKTIKYIIYAIVLISFLSYVIKAVGNNL